MWLCFLCVCFGFLVLLSFIFLLCLLSPVSPSVSQFTSSFLCTSILFRMILSIFQNHTLFPTLPSSSSSFLSSSSSSCSFLPPCLSPSSLSSLQASRVKLARTSYPSTSLLFTSFLPLPLSPSLISSFLTLPFIFCLFLGPLSSLNLSPLFNLTSSSLPS